MTGIHHSGQDDERLAQRLRELDPARGVAPFPEQRIEDIVNTITTSDTGGRQPGTAPEKTKRRRLGFVAGVATAAAAAAVITAVVVAQPAPGGSLALSQPEADLSMMCAPLSAEFIADTDLALEGRVTDIAGSTVNLEVLHQYSGEQVSTVTVPQGTGDLIELTTERFEVGGTYLISAVDGVITTCGMSGPSTPELKSLYEEAFS